MAGGRATQANNPPGAPAGADAPPRTADNPERATDRVILIVPASMAPEGVWAGTVTSRGQQHTLVIDAPGAPEDFQGKTPVALSAGQHTAQALPYTEEAMMLVRHLRTRLADARAEAQTVRAVHQDTIRTLLGRR